jgi:TusA-related sulfurtransferase
MVVDRIDRTIDVQGQICPYPFVEIKKALKELEQGQVLEVLTDYEPTVKTTIPSLCERMGHFFKVATTNGKTWRVFINKNA